MANELVVTNSAKAFVPEGRKGCACVVAVAFGDGERKEEGYESEGSSEAAVG